jgi:hypothetical protein
MFRSRPAHKVKRACDRLVLRPSEDGDAPHRANNYAWRCAMAKKGVNLRTLARELHMVPRDLVSLLDNFGIKVTQRSLVSLNVATQLRTQLAAAAERPGTHVYDTAGERFTREDIEKRKTRPQQVPIEPPNTWQFDKPEAAPKRTLNLPRQNLRDDAD